MLTFLIRTPEVPVETAEDVYSNAVGLLFPDNLRTFHGDPGSHVTYLSKRFGDMELRLADPLNEEDRTLFAHYIWNSGIQMAEFISQANDPSKTERDLRWDVEGETILELGAGTGIVGITSALAGGEEVILSDYPSQKILSTLKINVDRNVPEILRYPKKVGVQGHEWGVLTDEFSRSFAGHFTRVLCADCLWMDGNHYGLAQSITHFLSEKEEARAWVIAGFHTGRAKLVTFFDTTSQAGLEIETIWERDADGKERDWDREREDKERNRWLVIAILKHGRKLGKMSDAEKQQQYYASILMQKSNRHT